MVSDKAIRLCATWQGREETDASREARLRTFLHHSRTPGRHWHGNAAGGETIDLTSHPDQVPGFLAQAMRESQEGEHAFAPGMGSMAELFAFEGSGKLDIDAPAMSIMWGKDRYNHVDLTSNTDGPVDPRFVTYDIIRTNLLAMAAAFEPEWCEALPFELDDYFDREVYVRPAIGLSWMVWLCPTYAKLVQPPPRYTHIIVEHMNDGSLFMATGKQAFDCDDDLHMRQARNIQRRIDPLNYTLPFDGEWGRSKDVPPFPKV